MLEQLRQRLIVSVQAEVDEPFGELTALLAMAESVLMGGASALRMADMDAIGILKTQYPQLPIIGLTKPEPIPSDVLKQVYITPTFADVTRVVASGADIVALDATDRPRPDDVSLEDIVRQCRETFPSTLLMADIATLAEGIQAEALGFDMVSTTLSGYTQETRESSSVGPDFLLLEQLVARVSCPVILEGRIWEPAEVTRAFEQGAYSVVIGSAITRPHQITQRFCKALPS